jgi:hypothetical protein
MPIFVNTTHVSAIHCLKQYTPTKECKKIREETVFSELSELITIPPDYRIAV